MTSAKKEYWEYFGSVFTLCLVFSIQCSPDSTPCKLGFVECPDGPATVCSDYLCTSVPDEERCKPLETNTVCNSTVRFEVQYLLKGQSFASLRSKFFTADKSSIVDKIERGAQIEIGEVDTLVYSSEVFGLRMYLSKSNWYEVLTFCQTSSNVFHAELADFLEYEDFLFLPSVSYVKVLTEEPREGQELKLESLFMKTSGYSSSGISWSVDGKQLNKKWFTVTPVGPNLFISQLEIPAEELSKDLNGQYLFLYWEDHSNGYIANSLKTDIEIEMKPLVALNGTSEFYIGLTPPATFCCTIETSDNDWKQQVRLEFQPSLSKNIVEYISSDSDRKIICTDLEFDQPYEGSLVCLYPYWNGDVTDFFSITAVQPSDSDFCAEVQDDKNDVIWPKTLVPGKSTVSVDLDCPSRYDGTFSRVCSRDENANVAQWNPSINVLCHSTYLADSCNELTSYDVISTCLVNLKSFFDTSAQFSYTRFQTSDTIFALSTLRNILGSSSLIINFDLEKVEDIYGKYLEVIQQLVQVPSLAVWDNVNETSGESFYSNFELITQMNSILFGVLEHNRLFVGPTINESANADFQKWTFFRMKNQSSISLNSEMEDFLIEFDFVDMAAISLLPESMAMLELISKETVSPNVVVISSNNQGLYTVRFEGILLDKWNPVCKYLDFNNQWSNDSCFIRFEGDIVKCRCQHINQPASVNALFLQERKSFSRSAGLTVLERAFKNTCSVIAMLLFIATLVLVIRFQQPFTERSFVICQFAGGQVFSIFFFVVAFVNEVQMSPNSCAALTAFTKFFFLYSFLWLRFEAKFTKKSVIKKIKGSVAREMKGGVISRKLIIHCVISGCICATFIAITEILHYYLDDEYPPEFEDSLCEMLQDHYLTNFVGAVLSILVSYIQHLLLFRKLYILSRKPETADAVKALKFYHSRTVRLILLLIYPSIILCVIFQLISYYTDTKTFTILWSVSYMMEPGLLLLYSIAVHRSETLATRPHIPESSPVAQRDANSEESAEGTFHGVHEIDNE